MKLFLVICLQVAILACANGKAVPTKVAFEAISEDVSKILDESMHLGSLTQDERVALAGKVSKTMKALLEMQESRKKENLNAVKPAPVKPAPAKPAAAKPAPAKPAAAKPAPAKPAAVKPAPAKPAAAKPVPEAAKPAPEAANLVPEADKPVPAPVNPAKPAKPAKPSKVKPKAEPEARMERSPEDATPAPEVAFPGGMAGIENIMNMFSMFMPFLQSQANAPAPTS